MYVTTLPVYSRLAPDQDVPEEIQAQIPAGWRLSTHQVEPYRALCSDVDIVFNTAMTGDGKSLAGQLPTLLHPRYALAMYPTNELIGDQLRQTEETLHRWQQGAIRLVRLDARALDKVEAEAEIQRAAALLNLYSNHELVLTNPDIFHYVIDGVVDALDHARENKAGLDHVLI